MDAKPREIFITACLLIPIVGIGLYPKVAMETYNVKTVAVAAHVRDALPVVAQQRDAVRTANLLSLTAPQLLK